MSLLSPTSPSPLVGSKNRKDQLSQQARNPVALRLYKVLGTNFNDEATQEALATVSDLYATPHKLSLKANTESDDETDGYALGIPSAQDELDEVVTGEAAARARKNLRRDIEHKLAQGSQQFLKALGEVDQVCMFIPDEVSPLYAHGIRVLCAIETR